MATTDRLLFAFQHFDAANKKDPNTEVFQGRVYPKEVLHAQKASSILKEVGYKQETIDAVSFLLEKKQLKRNADTQTLEDVICLVFLEYYFESFAYKHPNEKTIEILEKTWRKMSDKGKEAALKLPLSKFASDLVTTAVAK